MSMISSLIDKLNKSADEWNGSNMFELARMCREAADTIWELRDDLQRANDENAKLRKLVRDAWGGGHPDRSCEGCDIRDECHNDVERMRKDGMLRFSRCLFERRIEERMRELGIEV